jgi:hypothetical protein
MSITYNHCSAHITTPLMAKHCPQCHDLNTKLISLKWEYNRQVQYNAELEIKCSSLTSRVLELEHAYDEQGLHTLPSDNPAPEDIRIKSFPRYVSGLVQCFPVIAMILALFISKSHKRKEKAHNTKTKWLTWAGLYRAFIVDVFIRACAAKTVCRTNLLLGTYMLLGGVSEPCWRLFQRVRILPSKLFVENWIKSHTKTLLSHNSFLFYVLDNCDISQHVTHVRRGRRTTMLHLINRYVIYAMRTSAHHNLPCAPVRIIICYAHRCAS